VKKTANNWNVYCTRFLIKAKQLDSPLTFMDTLGHEHHGDKGDYFVEGVDGRQTILTRQLFEDVYITMGPAKQRWQVLSERKTASPSNAQPGGANLAAPARAARGIN